MSSRGLDQCAGARRKTLAQALAVAFGRARGLRVSAVWANRQRERLDVSAESTRIASQLFDIASEVMQEPEKRRTMARVLAGRKTNTGRLRV